jgi:hypothetical protein
MGMQTWAAEDYGLYVTADDFKEYADKHSIDADDVGDDNGFTSYSEAEGACYRIINNDKNESFPAGNHFFIGTLRRFPDLFSQAYQHEQEALQELKGSYSEFLPENFDYEGKFVHFIGTTFG